LLILIALAASVAIIQPYRQDLAVYSTVDIVLILIMTAWYESILCTTMANKQPTHISKFLLQYHSSQQYYHLCISPTLSCNGCLCKEGYLLEVPNLEAE